MRSCPPTRLLLGILIVVTILWLATLVFLVGNCPVGDAAPGSHYDAGADHDRQQPPRAEWRRAAGQRQLVGATRLYIITPTYARLVQKAELTRLSHAFCLAAVHGFDVHWIVVEDAASRSALVAALLAEACRLPGGDSLVPLLPNLPERVVRGQLRYTHLHEPTPEAGKLRPADPNWLLPRGVLQRNAALRWLRMAHADRATASRAVVYFADDDNTYDVKLFYEMVLTQKVSVWPVGIVGYLKYEAPIVKDGKVVSWYTYWYRERRRFAMDMAGFAVSLGLIISNPEAAFSLDVERGFQESTLLSKLGVTMNDLEPRADNCTKVFVWHTRSEVPSLKNERKMSLKYNETYPIPDVIV